jgi:DNA-binding FadR family transcriptional regulator
MPTRIGQTKGAGFSPAPVSRVGSVAHPPTAAAGVVQRLRGRIVSGALQPGTALPPERELAEQLDVSRATLREGLSILAHMGLVTIQRGRSGGAVVTAPPAATVSSSITLLFQTRVVTAGQLCEFRRALEVEAAQLAATRRGQSDLTTIASALQAYVASGSDPTRQNSRGRAFHYAVARASGNPLLTETLLSLDEAFAECFDLQHAVPDPAWLIHDIHAPICDAIRQRDAVAARRAMLAHFDQLDQALGELGLSQRPVASHGESSTISRNAQDLIVARG